jgi:tripeptidyl-peptidase-1
MLNDARARSTNDRSQRPMGFLNPFLYQTAAMTPGAFNDVTVGQNGCGAYGHTPLCCDSDFVASPGWDAMTGLGSPSYPELRDAAVKALKHTAN